MKNRISAAVCAVAVLAGTASAFAQTPRFAPGKYHVGSHVLGDPTAMHRWIACTITSVRILPSFPNEVNAYTAKCADGIEYTLIADADHVRPAGAPPAGHAMSTVNPYRYQIAHGNAQQYHAVNTGSAPLRSGVYHCIAGFSTMLTYGDITISGNSFTFRAPDGSGGSGTYSADANGRLHWHGNFGVLSRAPWVIESSNKQLYVPDAISFYYHRSDGIRRSMSCRRT